MPCYVAATLAKEPGSLSNRIVGDGLVPLTSALGQMTTRPGGCGFRSPASAWCINHLDMLSDTQVYEQFRQWLAATS